MILSYESPPAGGTGMTLDELRAFVGATRDMSGDIVLDQVRASWRGGLKSLRARGEVTTSVAAKMRGIAAVELDPAFEQFRIDQ